MFWLRWIGVIVLGSTKSTPKTWDSLSNVQNTPTMIKEYALQTNKQRRQSQPTVIQVLLYLLKNNFLIRFLFHHIPFLFWLCFYNIIMLSYSFHTAFICFILSLHVLIFIFCLITTFLGLLCMGGTALTFSLNLIGVY